MAILALGAVARRRAAGFVGAGSVGAGVSRAAVVRTVVVRAVVLRAGVGEGPVQGLVVQTRRVERVPPPTVRQRQPGGDPHVVLGDLVAAAPGGMRDGGAGGDDVG